jgi:hypothetical protein
MATWKQSVTKARTALLKTFEGRMVAAAASFEQVPPNGKGANGSLAEFARDVGVEYQTLNEYRQVWSWLGSDLRHVPQIGNYSVAREAMKSKPWSKRSAAEFVETLEKAEKVIRVPGFEPYFFDEWTVDAVRAVLLGQQPKKTLLVQMTAIETGQDPTDEELDEAEAEDELSDAIDRFGAERVFTFLSKLFGGKAIQTPIETPMDTVVAMAELERWVAEGDRIVGAVEDAVATGQVSIEETVKPADDTEALARRLRTAHQRSDDFDRGLEDLLRQGA